MAIKPKFAVRGAVSVPDMVLENEVTAYLVMKGAFTESRPTVDPKTGEEKAGPTKARILDIGAGLPGELKSLLCPTMLRNQLEEAFPDHEYIGRAFAVTMHAPAKGKRYRLCEVLELDVDVPMAGE